LIFLKTLKLKGHEKITQKNLRKGKQKAGKKIASKNEAERKNDGDDVKCNCYSFGGGGVGYAAREAETGGEGEKYFGGLYQ